MDKKRNVCDISYDRQRALQQKGPAEAVARLQRFVGHAAVNFDRAQELADLLEVLAGLRRNLPKVRAWCVMKHYSDHDPKSGTWKPIVWCACKTREHAEAIAKATQAHYDARQLGGCPDKFVVERGEAHVSQLIAPECTPEYYVAGLGT